MSSSKYLHQFLLAPLFLSAEKAYTQQLKPFDSLRQSANHRRGFLGPHGMQTWHPNSLALLKFEMDYLTGHDDPGDQDCAQKSPHINVPCLTEKIGGYEAENS